MSSSFPGVNGIAIPTIDAFPNLLDSTSPNTQINFQQAKSSYYNNMVDCLQKARTYLTFLPGVTSIPTTSVLVTSDGTVNNVSTPVIYSYPVNSFIGLVSSSHKTSLSGNMLPFEFIISTTNNTGWYSNRPTDGNGNPIFFIQDTNNHLYNLVDTGMVSVTLSPIIGSTPDPLASTSTDPNGYASSLSVIYHLVKGCGEYIIRGFIIDNAAYITSNPSFTPNLTRWNSYGSSMNLNFAFLAVN